MGRAFRFTQENSTPYADLDGVTIISNGTETEDKLLLLAADGLGSPDLQPQVQKAPFQQGASLIRTLFEPRVITLECVIVVPAANTVNADAVATIKKTISRKLSPIGMGFLPSTSLPDPTYATYVGQLEYAADGETYNRTITAVPMKVEFPNAYYKDSFQKVRLVFFCPDPFWYGAEVSYTVNTLPYNFRTTVWTQQIKYVSELKKFYCLKGFQSSSPVYHFLSSDDGISWDTVGLTSDGDYRDFAYLPNQGPLGRFVIVGGATNGYAYSDDLGVTWTTYSPPVSSKTSVSIEYIPWADTLIGICLSSDKVFVGNGTSWTTYTHAGGGSYNGTLCVSSDRREIVAVNTALAGSQTLKSTDAGVTWTAYSAATTRAWTGVCWSSELALYCAIGYDALNTVRTQTSPDGQTWTGHTVPGVFPFTQSSSQRLIWVDFLGLFVGSWDTTSDIEYVTYSTDGATWTNQAIGGASNATGAIAASPEFGVVTLASKDDNAFPYISNDGIHFESTSTYRAAYIENDGDVDIPFQATVRVVAVSNVNDGFFIGAMVPLAGSEPATNRFISVTTYGMNIGDVEIDTTFGQKKITKNGVSIMNRVTAGTFFSLNPGTTNFYCLNTFDPVAVYPTVTIRPRYIEV